LSLPPEQGSKARTQTPASTGSGLFGLLLTTTAALGGRHVAEHLLDMHSAARERRPTALPALHPPAHQTPPAFSTHRASACASRSRWTSSMSIARTFPMSSSSAAAG